MRANAAFLTEFARGAAQFRASRESASPLGDFPTPPPGYTIRRVLGRGGQAVVYEAVQASTRRRVALKVVRLGSRDAARRLRRFDREIDLVSNLRHPLIVTVFDSGITSEGDPYLVMEYIEGSPIAHHEREPVGHTLARFQRVCEAVRHAHQHGVVHRDLKPSNILVDAQGLPRVLDFGLATTIDPRDAQDLTRSGEFLGTPIYAAPEQLRDGASNSDVRTDVYALGTILYELLTGIHPFGPHSALADLVKGILENDPTPPSARVIELDDEIDTIVLKAMAKEPERRYPSVDALHADIGRYLSGEPIDAKRDSRWYVLRKSVRRHRWAVASAVGLMVLLLAFGTVMSALYRRADETSRQLATTLATRELDHAIELTRADNLPAAEALLWSELLKWTNEGGSIAACARGPLLSRRAYWGLWELYQRQPCTASVRPGPERVRDLEVVSPERILAATVQGEIVGWNPTTGEMQTIFAPKQRNGPFHHVAMRPDVDRVMLVRDADVTCWSIEASRLISAWNLESHENIVRWSNIARTPLHIVVASGHSDGLVRVWDTETGDLLATVPLPDNTTPQPVVDDAGIMRITGISDAPMTALDLNTGESWTSRESVWAGRLAVAPDGRFVHSGKIWSGTEEQRLTALEESTLTRVYKWRFGAGGGTVIGGGATAPIWRADTGKLVRVLASYDATLCAVGPDDRTVATAHADGTVRAWDAAADAAVRRIPVSHTAHCVRFDADGRRLVIAGAGPQDEPILRLVDVGSDSHELGPGPGETTTTVSSAEFLPGGKMLVTGDHAGVAVLWKIESDAMSRVGQVQLPAAINDVALTTSGEWIAAACEDWNVWLWRPADGTLRALEGHSARVSSVEFSADGTRVISGSGDGTVRHWETDRTSSKTLPGSHNGCVRSIVYSPGHGLIASAGDDQLVNVSDARTGRLLRRLAAHGSRVCAVALSPDGRLLASGDANGDVKLWDVESGAELASLYGHTNMVFSLDFDPSGDRLASGAADASVRLWNLRHFDRHMAGNLDYQRALRRSPDAQEASHR